MTDRKVGPKALGLMHHFENCELAAYADPGTGGEPYTIGWGMTYYPDGRKVKGGDRITQAQADADFATILDRDFARAVDAAIGSAPTTAAQFGAMVALAYNIGMGPRIWLPGRKKGFRQSQVLKMHLAGRYAEAADAFSGWTTAGGKVMGGLVRRRDAEAALYRGDMAEVARLTHGAVR
ncbi:MAG: lysozyme [Sphingomonas sp.]|uniref:lysozyme n=1 Tax=Sphingomonas sp. TaxID=28214 RepID=UPI00258BF64B|nr:lysozyme [Sphingomonas sp.]MCP4025665.1 lysozyme [Sphingomonas sp.]